MNGENSSVDWVMHCYVKRYKSNEFIEIYRVCHEKVKFWLENQNPKNLTFQVF